MPFTQRRATGALPRRFRGPVSQALQVGTQNQVLTGHLSQRIRVDWGKLRFCSRFCRSFLSVCSSEARFARVSVRLSLCSSKSVMQCGRVAGGPAPRRPVSGGALPWRAVRFGSGRAPLSSWATVPVNPAGRPPCAGPAPGEPGSRCLSGSGATQSADREPTHTYSAPGRLNGRLPNLPDDCLASSLNTVPVRLHRVLRPACA